MGSSEQIVMNPSRGPATTLTTPVYGTLTRPGSQGVKVRVSLGIAAEGVFSQWGTQNGMATTI